MTNAHQKSLPSQFLSRSDDFAVSLNVKQWRSDIKAFSDTTRKMLDSIHDELSNGLATGTARTSPHSVAPNNLPPVAQRPLPDRAQSTEERSIAAASASVVEDDCDQLLANLRKQLDSQLNQ